MTSDRRLCELEANAMRAGQRYRLYRARVLGRRPASGDRFRQLQRESERAEGILAGAKAAPSRG
jgi:hypothetical protein